MGRSRTRLFVVSSSTAMLVRGWISTANCDDPARSRIERTRRLGKSITEIVLLELFTVSSVLVWKLYATEVGLIPTRGDGDCFVSKVGLMIVRLLPRLDSPMNNCDTGS